MLQTPSKLGSKVAVYTVVLVAAKLESTPLPTIISFETKLDHANTINYFMCIFSYL